MKIKNFITAIALFTFIGCFQNAFSQEVVTNSLLVKANSEKLWKEIVSFDNLEKYNPESIKSCIVEGEGVGAIRTLTLLDGGVVKEELLNINNKNHIINYKMNETSMPVIDYRAELRIRELDDGYLILSFTSIYDIAEENRMALKSTLDKFQKIQLLNMTNLVK